MEFNFIFLTLSLLAYIFCVQTENGKFIDVIHEDEDNSLNENNSVNELDNSEYIYMNEDEDFYNIKSSSVEKINLKDEIYFYKSFTKVIKSFKYGIPIDMKIAFEYNDGNIILLGSDKKGVIFKTNDIYYNELGLKYLDNEEELYIKNETFQIKYKSNLNNDKIKTVTLCEIKNDMFLPTKYLCYPSSSDEIKVAFIKNEEYNNLLQLTNSYMSKDNPDLIKNISDYIQNLYGVNFYNKTYEYYIFNKTILCNLQNYLGDNLKDNDDDEDIQNKLKLISDANIAKNNKYIFNNVSNHKKTYGRFIIWRHKNEDLIKKNFEKCNTFFFNQRKYFNYENQKNVYEILLNIDMTFFDKFLFKEIKSLSSVNEYTALFYNNSDYVILLKNYKFHLYFQLKNIIDIVLFLDDFNNISFYYISLNENDEKLNLHRCDLNSDELKCKNISFIPYENNLQLLTVYLSTVQKRDVSSVFISTRDKIWKIYKNESNLYKRKIISFIKNTDMEYYGHINCYLVETVYQKKLLYKHLSGADANVEKISGCSYLKHFNNFENSLLISFIENKHFIQYTYHIVKDKSFIISFESMILILKVNKLSYLIIIFIIILCILLAIYTIHKIILIRKLKIGKVKHQIFNDETKSSGSTIVNQ